MGCDEAWISEMNPSLFEEGRLPQTEKEAVLTANARDALRLQIGDTITVNTPDGSDLTYTVTGFVGNASKNSSEDSYGIILSMDSFFSIYPAQKHETLTDYNTCLLYTSPGAEYRLLGLLLRNAGRVVTRDTILNELWDEAGSFVDDNTLSVYCLL